MGKHALVRQNARRTPVEYQVYIHHPKRIGKRPGRWERASRTHDMALALEQAQMLYDSERYEKVEVKKKYFCAMRNKKIGQTCKTFQKDTKTADTIKSVIAKIIWLFTPPATDEC